jgi:hypothetical protein
MSFFMDAPRVRFDNVCCWCTANLWYRPVRFSRGRPANAVFLALVHPVACLPMPVMVPAPEHERARRTEAQTLHSR